MFKKIIKEKTIILLLIVALLLKLLSLNAAWVEKYYSHGFYPVASQLQRVLFGWVPFSIGDIFYFAATVYLLVKTWQFLGLFRGAKFKRQMGYRVVKKIVLLTLFVYLTFNILWGLNYDRQGIAHQLNLNVQPYSLQELETLTKTLHYRLNHYAGKIDSVNRSRLESNKYLFSQSIDVYREANEKYTFLLYKHAAIKPSLFSQVGHFFGFTGYYNPFSGEAQVKTTVPDFLKPFIVMHEIAHQLGYAKENEANFVTFLTCASTQNAEFKYSVYFELFNYALNDINRRDTAIASGFRQNLHPQVIKDREELKEYLQRNANVVEPIMTRFYDQYLKWNSQPKGKRTYNEVITWLVAYMKKYGVENI